MYPIPLWQIVKITHADTEYKNTVPIDFLFLKRRYKQCETGINWGAAEPKDFFVLCVHAYMFV